MRVGIVGYGHLGQYLVERIQEVGTEHDIEIDFVWNRSTDKLEGKVEKSLILETLEDCSTRKVDLIVEVCHPEICKNYGEKFLQHCNLFVGSPTAFADQETEKILRSAVVKFGHSLYVPSGALWGATDIKKMADRGSLKGLKVTMKKHPSSFRLHGNLEEINSTAFQSNHPVTLYEGPVRKLCPLAPNNVNTMAAAAIAGHNLGFDEVVGCLISDSSLLEWHIVEVDVLGPTNSDNGNTFNVTTTRKNPASAGAVTGNATFASFFSSLIRARNQGSGIHMC
uniref:putative L-aspartate dehydrogenase isoform X1 n=1 Tax=Styela clava TaxID=7725 RepID=UPI00193A8E6C|nr:putative L-aspartate dehydrogenase isoform X1 [Styela clava]